jgi:hypothetical protein
MNSLLSFQVILFFFVLLLLFLLCATERLESSMLSVIELIFCKEVFFLKFHLNQCQIVGYVDNFYFRRVSVCQEWVFFVLGDEAMEEAYHQ